MALPLIPLAVAGAGVIARFIAKKGMKEAVKKYGKKAVTEVQKNAKDMVTKPTAGQAGTKAGVRGMRNARQLGRQAAGVGAVGVGVPSALAIAKLRTKFKQAKTETARVQAQKDIDNAVAKVVVAEEKAKNNSSAPKKSIKPKSRPKPMRPKSRP